MMFVVMVTIAMIMVDGLLQENTFVLLFKISTTLSFFALFKTRNR